MIANDNNVLLKTIHMVSKNSIFFSQKCVKKYQKSIGSFKCIDTFSIQLQKMYLCADTDTFQKYLIPIQYPILKVWFIVSRVSLNTLQAYFFSKIQILPFFSLFDINYYHDRKKVWHCLFPTV